MQATSSNSIRSQLLKAAAQNTSVFLSRASTCHSSFPLWYVLMALQITFTMASKLGQVGVWSYSVFLGCIFLFKKKICNSGNFLSCLNTHNGRESNRMNTHTHFPSAAIDILPILFYLSPQICYFCFSWNILKQNQTSCLFYPNSLVWISD